jgi:periplasmic protein TonB
MFERIEVASPSRPWATTLAFLVNSTALLLAILFPLVKPDQLPAVNFKTWTAPYSAPHAEVPAEARVRPVRTDVLLNDSAIREPSSIPKRINMDAEKPTNDPVGKYIPGTEGLVSKSGFDGPWIGIATTNPPPLPIATRPPRPKTLIVSHLDEGMLINRVQPIYPPMAKITHTQGTVVLSALISPKGEIEGLEVLSGPALLVESAKNAVRQWRYRPYILNGAPIEVRTQVTVNFSLQ